MNFLKRIELWVLLAVIVAGLVWVFTSGSSDDEEPGASDGATSTVEADEAPLKLHRCVLERDYGNARLDIELRVRNDSADKLVLQAPKVKLLTDKGREVPSFFLPFDPVPEVAAKSTLDVQLRYWLDGADLQGALSLEVDGKTLLVKGAKTFDLKSLKNAEKKVLETKEW